MLRLGRLTPLLVAALAVAGCGNTGGEPEQIISGDLGSRVSSGTLLAATLAAEVALVVAEPPGPGSCPSIDADGDQLTLDYGTGCVPSSGVTTEPIGGTVTLVVAGGMGVFAGEVQSFGFSDLPMVGELSGDVVRAGDLLSADVEFEGLNWTEAGTDNTLDALFEIEADDGAFLLNARTGSFLRGQPLAVEFDLEEVGTSAGAMGACFVPEAGTIRLERGAATATLTYTADSASSGSVGISYNDRDPETLTPCP